MTIDRMLSLFAIIVSFVAVPASGYLSYHFAIKGEMRKEWNALAEPVIDYFSKKSKEHSVGAFYPNADIPFDKIIPLRRRFSKKESASFESAFSAYITLTNKFNNQTNMMEEDRVRGCNEAELLAKAIVRAVKLK